MKEIIIAEKDRETKHFVRYMHPFINGMYVSKALIPKKYPAEIKVTLEWGE